MYPYQLTVEKVNKLGHLVDHLDLTFVIDSGGKLSTPGYMTIGFPQNVTVITTSSKVVEFFYFIVQIKDRFIRAICFEPSKENFLKKKPLPVHLLKTCDQVCIHCCI